MNNYTDSKMFNLLPLILKKRWIIKKILDEMCLQKIKGPTGKLVKNDNNTRRKLETLSIHGLKDWYERLFFGKYKRLLGKETFPSSKNIIDLKSFKKDFKKYNN